MRRSIFVVILLALILVPALGFCFHIIGESAVSKLSLQTDLMRPKEGDDFVAQKVIMHVQKGDLGLGGETLIITKKDYLRFRPYVTLKAGPVTPIMGLSTDSAGQDFVNAGLWYAKKVGARVNLFVDLRNYWGLNGDSNGFTDNLLAVSVSLSDQAYVGVDLFYDHYWETDDDWYKIGIPVGYKLTKDVTVFLRPGFERFLPQGGEHADTESLRLGLNVNF